MKKKLINLSEVKKFANELRLAAVENQASGGCGFFARETFKFFKQLGYDPKIILMAHFEKPENYKKYPQKINELMAENKSVSEYVPDHIVVRVNKFYFDSDGYGINRKGSVKIAQYKNIFGAKISLDALSYLLKNRRGWNDFYQRKNNKTLREKFKRLNNLYI